MVRVLVTPRRPARRRSQRRGPARCSPASARVGSTLDPAGDQSAPRTPIGTGVTRRRPVRTRSRVATSTPSSTTAIRPAGATRRRPPRKQLAKPLRREEKQHRRRPPGKRKRRRTRRRARRQKSRRVRRPPKKQLRKPRKQTRKDPASARHPRSVRTTKASTGATRRRSVHQLAALVHVHGLTTRVPTLTKRSRRRPSARKLP